MQFILICLAGCVFLNSASSSNKDPFQAGDKESFEEGLRRFRVERDRRAWAELGLFCDSPFYKAPDALYDSPFYKAPDALYNSVRNIDAFPSTLQVSCSSRTLVPKFNKYAMSVDEVTTDEVPTVKPAELYPFDSRCNFNYLLPNGDIVEMTCYKPFGSRNFFTEVKGVRISSLVQGLAFRSDPVCCDGLYSVAPNPKRPRLAIADMVRESTLLKRPRLAIADMVRESDKDPAQSELDS